MEVGPTRSSGYALSPKFVKEQDTTYWVKESKAPNGYALSDEVKPIIPGTDKANLQVVTFTDNKRQIQIRVNKTDSDDSEPLAGAYFKIYKTETDAQSVFYGPPPGEVDSAGKRDREVFENHNQRSDC